MRSIQGSFPRIKDTLRYEECGDRETVLELIIRLSNLRANLVGINQIKNTFIPSLDKDADTYFQ